MIKYRKDSVVMTHTYGVNEVPPSGFYISESGLLSAKHPKHTIVFDTHLPSLGINSISQLTSTLHKPQQCQIEFVFDTNKTDDKQLLFD